MRSQSTDSCPKLKKLSTNFRDGWTDFKSLLLDANSGPESSGTGLKSGSAYDLLDLVTLAPLDIVY